MNVFMLHSIQLIQRDIDIYVVAKLEMAAQPASDVYSACELRQLAQAVCGRLEGVFLWIALAVKVLRRGIESQDSLRMLHDRLKNYPLELRNFIQRIFDSIDSAYQKQHVCYSWCWRTQVLRRS